ncbi:methyltransferase domain-containing protein [Streptomyces sp. NRRL B-1677]|uniref:Class I SAM-dependent methyltransferase n=1 Tax=Streptomyces klenkii TaxID=1420899 RepID=A0A3B0BG62_9ACTN|nr:MULTISPECIES: class I SAM-dependent methyltransferase [Streptomyces]MBF6047662.1 methyltransferase domain-containing protein [Streptomyces sp. NRRL B-1677]RKN71682.1 class I SAM-dependent methyltransferase [Streptomyces klenkii]
MTDAADGSAVRPSHDDLQYDRIGEDYELSKLLPLTMYVERPSVLGLLADVRGKSVLDLACGTGVYTRHARRLGAERVLGVDISPKMIEACRAAEERARLGVEYAVGDASALPRLGEFDVLLAAYLFNYAASPEALEGMARNCARNLRPGGALRAFVAHPDFDFGHPLPERYGFSFEREPDPAHDGRIRVTAHTDPRVSFCAYLPSGRAFEEAFAAAGFRDCAWEPVRLSVEGELEHGPAYWDDFRANPPWAVFRCVKRTEGSAG